MKYAGYLTSFYVNGDGTRTLSQRWAKYGADPYSVVRQFAEMGYKEVERSQPQGPGIVNVTVEKEIPNARNKVGVITIVRVK